MLIERPLVVCAIIALSAGGALAQDIVRDWNAEALAAIQANPLGPPPNARALAMMHVAMYDANASITQASQTYTAMPVGPADASRQAAVAKAAHDVLVSVFPSRAATFDARLASQLAALPAGQSLTEGLSVGAVACSNALAVRAADGSTAASTWVQGNAPTSWRPTGASPSPQFNQYALVTPWTMTSPSQFRRAAPPLPGSPEYQAAYNEVRDIGSATSATRTADQTNIARFWAGNPGSVTPPGQWNLITQNVAAARAASFDDELRVFALVNLALSDASIASWDMKLHYDYYRPITAIQATDPTWTPLLATPQFQSYTSGHSLFSGAAAAVLGQFFGDATSFDLTLSDPSLGVVNMTRSYSSFSQAAAEAGQSRIYGGIHWQFDNTESLAAGRELGEYVFNTALRVPGPGAGSLLAVAGLIALRRRR